MESSSFKTIGVRRRVRVGDGGTKQRVKAVQSEIPQRDLSRRISVGVGTRNGTGIPPERLRLLRALRRLTLIPNPADGNFRRSGIKFDRLTERSWALDASGLEVPRKSGGKY